MGHLKAPDLSRHDAVHAAASVVAEFGHNLFNAKADACTPWASENAALEWLTAKGWWRPECRVAAAKQVAAAEQVAVE